MTSLSGFAPDNTKSPVKFNLYLKIHELEEVGGALQRIMLLPKKQRQRWLKDYGELIHQAFDTFVDDSNTILDHITLEEDVLELSERLVVSLRDTITMVEGMLDESDAKLTS